MTYIVGEKLNSSIPSTGKAMLDGNMEFLTELARSQAENGADCIDINTALCGSGENDMLCKLTDIVKSQTECHIMLDSPSPEAIIAALPHTEGRYTILNSVTVDERIDELIPYAKEFSAGIVGLPIRAGHIPSSPEERLANASAICEKLTASGVSENNIYIDALAEAVATEPDAGKRLLETVKLIKKELPSVHLICGLSNVSFGLPKRGSINSVAATLLTDAGMDTFIADAASPSLKMALAAYGAFSGNDEYCIDYITHIRSL